MCLKRTYILFFPVFTYSCPSRITHSVLIIHLRLIVQPTPLSIQLDRWWRWIMVLLWRPRIKWNQWCNLPFRRTDHPQLLSPNSDQLPIGLTWGVVKGGLYLVWVWSSRWVPEEVLHLLPFSATIENPPLHWILSGQSQRMPLFSDTCYSTINRSPLLDVVNKGAIIYILATILWSIYLFSGVFASGLPISFAIVKLGAQIRIQWLELMKILWTNKVIPLLYREETLLDATEVSWFGNNMLWKSK